jgi:hypothetical protein
MRYSFDYIGHDMWHVTPSDDSGYWLLSSASVRGFLADYFDTATVTEIMAAEEFSAVPLDLIG